MPPSEAPDIFPSRLIAHIHVLFPTQIPKPLGAAELKTAFRRQALLWHPDRMPVGSHASIEAEWRAQMQRINLANTVLKEAVEDPSWTHGPEQDGQRGGQRGESQGTYTLRIHRFFGTISGLTKGELTTRLVEDQLDAKTLAIQREVLQLVVGMELHQHPAHPEHNHHVHFAIEFNERLYHKSSEYSSHSLLYMSCFHRSFRLGGHLRCDFENAHNTCGQRRGLEEQVHLHNEGRAMRCTP
jgi:hypothetical protein